MKAVKTAADKYGTQSASLFITGNHAESLCSRPSGNSGSEYILLLY
ncbi:MAG: hypothetical protein IKL00_02045 [Oscillospiraceae bacterium]|nr:hypothetical protein [Oscillospiraceae bacterium]